jgi:hypothetical protein
MGPDKSKELAGLLYEGGQFSVVRKEDLGEGASAQCAETQEFVSYAKEDLIPDRYGFPSRG